MSHRDAPPRLSAPLGRMLGRPRATAAARKSRASRGKLAQYRELALIHSCALPKPRTVDIPAFLLRLPYCFFTAVLCLDRKKSLQLIHIDTDRNRSDGPTGCGFLDGQTHLRNVPVLVLRHFVHEYGVGSHLVCLPVLGLIALVVVLGQVRLSDVEAFHVKHEDLENDAVSGLFFPSEESRQLVVHL